MQKIIFLCLACFISIILPAQHKFTLSGTVKARASGETIIGATIKAGNEGTTTNEYGFFSITLPAGKYKITYGALGFLVFEEELNLDASVTRQIFLDGKNVNLENVVINSSTSTRRSISNPQMGVEKLTTSEIKNIPVLFGEKDILKTIQLLPGVKSAGEGNSGFFVRGGSGDQNLILLDEAPVYNASHLLGFFSTFNSDAIKDMALYKGGMPAQYGGRLSSVLDIKMNDGNNQEHQASGGIGLISSKLNVEGPIKKGKASYLLTGRRTYADQFLRLAKDSAIKNNTVYFYDLNTKINYEIDKKNRLYLSGYFGKDVLKLGNIFGINWGNATGTLRWNHVFNDKLFSNTSLIFSNYNYQINIKAGADDFTITSKIEDWNIKNEYQWYANNKNTVRFGINAIHHTITPGNVTAKDTSGSINNSNLQNRYSFENAAYISNYWRASKKINLTYGMRLTAFSILGGGNFFNYNADGDVTDTIKTQLNSIVKTWINAEPRISLSYIINPQVSVKAAYVRNVQNLHLLSNSTSSSPTDKWVASTNVIKLEISDQVSVGYYRDFAEGNYELTVETYYKNMLNQIDYRDGANIYINSDAIESQLLFGKGRAYGIEWLLKKKSGNVTGWISYTLAKTEKKINGINNNKWYNARQDRTHDIAIVASWQVSPTWNLSANWIFYTGDAVTFPAGKYKVEDFTVFYYTERNGYRMPAYHRLDIGATKILKQRKKFTSELNFSIYNAYARENAYAINFRENKTNPEITDAVRFSLFKLVPSISYNFKF